MKEPLTYLTNCNYNQNEWKNINSEEKKIREEIEKILSDETHEQSNYSVTDLLYKVEMYKKALDNKQIIEKAIKEVSTVKSIFGNFDVNKKFMKGNQVITVPKTCEIY